MSALRIGSMRLCPVRMPHLFRPIGARRTINAKTTPNKSINSSINSAQRQLTSRGQDRGGQSSEWARRAGELAWVVCLAHCFVEYVAEPYTVEGPSMRPTIEHRSVLLVDKTRARGAPLQRGQIVVARSPVQPGRMLVKRILGLPGDSMKVRPPDWDVHNTLRIEKRLQVVPEGHVWLEGDNTDNSTDSRNYGPVPQALVEGVISCRLWPPRGFGLIA